MARPKSESRAEERLREKVAYFEWAKVERAKRQEERDAPGALKIECADCGHPRKRHQLKMHWGLLVEQCAAKDGGNFETGLCGCDVFTKAWDGGGSPWFR